MRSLRAWLHRWQRPDRHVLLDGLLATQALTREQVLRKQAEDLRAIVRFAAANTAYYREACGTPGDDFVLRDLPILRKQDVVARMRDLLARDADPLTTNIGHTGGSTGKPLAFWYDEAKHELMRAGMMRSYMMSGWRPGQKILNFWGARQDTVAGGVFGGKRLSDFMAAEKTIPAYEITAGRLLEWARFIGRYRPVLLQGYASILSALARFVVDNRIPMPGGLIGVYSTAEMLDDWQRKIIERAFGCQVFNQYGSREIPNIACECRRGSMHVFTDMVWLESLCTDGEERLIVTSLTNRLMPLIRYDVGDAGRLKEGDCPCGSPFPLMEMGMCRHNDMIRTPGGKRVHPSFFNRLLYGMTQIEHYQFIQDEPERITLNVVAPGPLDSGLVDALRTRIRHELDERMTLEVSYGGALERTASGKHRFVISNCA
ncbi:MAG: phenylacetate--CoA ligase family protein [Betaproteobacteria bacterium]|nr:phenylacetate--CoA ligase family protein [Betaproteobacteria bacterium]